ncbi:DUF6443 domain-containing protein [Tenacibaculum aiptasiae]|uniref:DUF6443 domain-containing protein n=1 Tax=Tenacibaculum aiptasiae TaxID=426481 RepID=UPI003B59DED8
MKKLLYTLLLMSCYSYGQEITIEKKDYTVNENENITLKATQSITLKPLTWIKQGAIFNAKIVEENYVPSIFSDENYVFTRAYRKALKSPLNITSTSDVIENITYLDGLGKDKQKIGIRQGANGKDIITHIEYDTFGRQTKEYLPYAANTQNGLIRTGSVAEEAKNYYKAIHGSDFADVNLPINSYSEEELENSPLNRIIKQAAPGQDWRIGSGHETKFDYLTNLNEEVKIFEVTNIVSNKTYTPSLIGGNTFYPEGVLQKNITKDENWTTGLDNTTEEFINKQGQLILKRVYNNSLKHDTYYVYDDFGNLTYVLPPKIDATEASSNLSVIQTKLNDLGYQYKYDHRNRLVEKKVPGKEWEYIIYDKLNRPVLIQDANLRAQNNWLFTKYDKFGRVVYTGIYNDYNTRIGMQQTVDDETDVFIEHRILLSNAIPNANIYYSNNSMPYEILGENIYTINYYDTYIDLPSELSNTIITSYGKKSSENTKNLTTVQKTRIFSNENNWITTVTYYDDKARPIYMYTKNDELHTIDIVENKLDDFTGRVLETKTTHKKTGQVDIITVDKFFYDNLDRVIKQTQTIGNNTEVIAENFYDELGKLQEKRIGGKENQSRLQTINYKYNIHGWLKTINQDNIDDNDLFNLSLEYNNPTSGKALYNGNISQLSWNTLNTDTSTKTYNYSYDVLNRITSAIDNTADNRYSLINVTYDKNGNIQSLKRNGHRDTDVTSFGLMDNLQYSYGNNNNSNQLVKVEELSGGSKVTGFKDAIDLTTEYVYDANGNLIKDLNKNIGTLSNNGITYNYLNLPSEIKFNNSNTQKINFIYDANGTKLKKIVNNNGNITTTEYAGNYVYKNNSLEFFNHPEGYVMPNNLGFKYVYNHLDYLGNVRLSYTDNNNDGVITASTEIIEEKNYYPFGALQKGYNSNYSSIGNKTAQKFGFGGKELNDDNIDGNQLNWHDFGSRNYDAYLGRWFTIDPKAEDIMQIDITPYNYSWNNPVNVSDPDGECPMCWGFVIGAAIDYGMQVAVNYAEGKTGVAAWTQVDKTKIFISATSGALTGGLNSIKAVSATDKVLKVVTQVAIDAGTETANQLNETKTVNGKDLIKNVVQAKLIDKGIGKIKVFNNVPKSEMATAKRVADRARRVNRSNDRVSRQKAARESKERVTNLQKKDKAIDTANDVVEQVTKKYVENAANTIRKSKRIKKDIRPKITRKKDNTKVNIRRTDM